MIVVDSSVWIANLRGLEVAPVARLRDSIRPKEILVGELVLLEILQGARSEKEAAELESHLRSFPIAVMSSIEIATKAAQNYRLLRSRGITIRKTPDLIIATFCIEQGHDLLQYDRDFLPMAEHLGLKLA